MNTVTYSIPNISCGHCVHTIQTELTEMPGIDSVIANQETRTVEIIFGSPATEDGIKTLLAEINYPVAS